MTKKDIALEIATKLDNYELLDLHNGTFEDITKEIQSVLENYLIIQGEVIKNG